jgi:tetratricopeptide (TPR) repeat protein
VTADSGLLANAIASHRAGNLDDAENRYKALLSSQPEHAHALTLLGTIYSQRGEYEKGIRLMEKAISKKPDHAEAYYNRGLALQKLGRHKEALESYDKAIAIDPAYGEAHNNRGLALCHFAQYHDALESYDKAIAINPRYAEAYWNKSLIKLLHAEYDEGWKLFEWRWKKGNRTARIFPQPLWLGKEPLKGKTILLHTEQGLGDTIQFCRYAPMVEASGAKVIIEAPATLTSLLSTLKDAFTTITTGSALPAFDFHCPLMSLPLALKTSADTIPATVPYLYADPQKQAAWQQQLGAKSRPRIGLSWAGGPAHDNDHARSMALNKILSLLGADGEFFSLQKEIRPEDAPVLAQHPRIRSYAQHWKDFSDTAAFIAGMDLVISVDTSVAHLAGALGKPVWILLPLVPDFRWLLEREDSPWYPTARLFRQTSTGDWVSVIEKVKTELSAINF